MPALAAETGASGPRPWAGSPSGSALAAGLAPALGVPELVALLLTRRGVRTPAEGHAFLRPAMEHLHDPMTMLGMDLAVARLQQAIAARESILIYGDYDVDGTTAVVLLKTAIERLGGSARYHVPHRLREGYGMQRQVLERAAAEAAEALGLDLIVTDHHLPDGVLPRALAVLDPNQPGCGYACKGLCGAGVAFKLSQALLEAATEDNPEARRTLRTKTLPSFLKLLAIATVADAVPLLGENRAIVALGLAALREAASPGLRALLAVAELDPARRPLTATDVGFRLGPRINAAGRMDVAGDVVELFTTRDAARAGELARKLNDLNTDRRATEQAALEAVMAMAASPEFAESRCLVLDGIGWHRGVIGILASRVVDSTGRPALVLAHEDGEAYGSGRSIEGFHLLAALESCADLFTRFGGHAHAVGFSLPSGRVAELRARLTAYAATHLPDQALWQPVRFDAELPLDRISPELFQALRLLEPFGMENPEPAFAAYSVRIIAEPQFLRERHCKLRLSQGAAQFTALGWRWADRIRDLGLGSGCPVDLVYRLRENEHPEFGGLELEIVDLRPSSAAG